MIQSVSLIKFSGDIGRLSNDRGQARPGLVRARVDVALRRVVQVGDVPVEDQALLLRQAVLRVTPAGL